MDLVTSMLSIFKSVNCTDREYKLIKQKLDFGIRKAEVLLDRSREDNVPEFMTTHLANRLADAREHLKAI